MSAPMTSRFGSLLNEDLAPRVAASLQMALSITGKVGKIGIHYHRRPKPLSRRESSSGVKNMFGRAVSGPAHQVGRMWYYKGQPVSILHQKMLLWRAIYDLESRSAISWSSVRSRRRRRSMINSLNLTRLCHLRQNDHVTERVSDSNSLSPRHRNRATMTSQTPGILRWTSSIRNSMINDPGRQFFEDQVQSQGFLFLEEYLDNIWAAAKQE